MVRIRAVTIFSKPGEWSTRALTSYLEESVSPVKDVVEEEKLDVWTFRLSLPRTPQGVDVVKLANMVQELSDDLGLDFVAPVHLDAKDPRIGEMREVLDQPKVFASVKIEDERDARRAADTIISVSEADPFLAAKLGIDLGYGIKNSPYYPISVASEEGFSLSLIYVEELREGLSRADPNALREVVGEVKGWAARVGEEISASGIPFIGTDLSPSPWMEESVAGVLEEASGLRISDPGIMRQIYAVNKAVWSHLKYGTVGYNELMLPLAEDDVLKRRGFEGLLSGRDLLRLTAACVAGLDMVVFPGDTSPEVLTGLILDQLTIREVKGRPMGTRMIVYPGASEGEKVRLGIFGEVPVIPV